MARASPHFHDVTLENAWVVAYPTDTGQWLRVAPAAVQARYRFAVLRENSDWGRVMASCQVRLADAEGGLWQCDSPFASAILFDALIDPTRDRPGGWVRRAPAEWQQALGQTPLLAVAGDSTDGRERVWFYLDGDAFFFHLKYFAFSADLFTYQGSTLLVRLHRLFGSYDLLPLAAEDGSPLLPPAPPTDLESEDESGAYLDNLDPLVYPLDVRRLLFRGLACLEEEGHSRFLENAVPRPLVFRRVSGRGDPQPPVTLSDSPPAPPDPVRAGRFVPEGLGGGGRIELLTRLGGRLHIEAEAGACVEASWERAPGSEREPADVARCVIRIADDSGRLWQAVTHFTADVLFEPMWRLFAGRMPRFEPEGDRPEVLLGDLRAATRGGGWRHLLLEDDAISLRWEDQLPRFDLLAGGWVRLRGLRGLRRRIEGRSQDDSVVFPVDPPATGVEEDLPPIVFSADTTALLFRNTTFAVDDGFWHHNDLPIPVIFDPVELTGEPQPAVRWVEPGSAAAP